MNDTNKNECMNNIEILRNNLSKMLMDVECIKFGKFILSSGKESDYYVDIKKATTNPKILKLIGKLVYEILKDSGDIKKKNLKIAGVELGSVPIATSVSLETEKPLIIVRKKPKSYGTKNKIEGDLEENDEVIVMEDVTTTGGSVSKAVEEIRKSGGIVKKVIVVVDRKEGAEDNLRNLNVEMIPLITVDMLRDKNK